MALSDQRTRSQKMAMDMLKRGIYHGRRMTKPFPNSGGLTMTSGPGSSKYQRRIAARIKPTQ